MSSLPPSQPVKKRSVGANHDIWPPVKLLELSKAAYDEQFINDDDRLEHSALIGTLYLGGFRINEALRLLKHQFKNRISLQKRPFMVIENAYIEKSGDKVRNVAVCPDDPISIPLKAHLALLSENDPLFSMTRKTAWNIADRVSRGEAWPHWFRAQRDRFLSTAFDPDERRRIMGWSRSEYKPGANFRTTEDRYAGLNWMFYADRLGSLTDSYWQGEPISDGTKMWLDSLSIRATTTTT